MNLLALETSSSLFSVSLKVGERYYSHQEQMLHSSAQTVLPTLQRLLLEGNVTLSSLDALVFGAGPGNFTGLRISGSVIQALAFACELPVILISSLNACAQAAFDQVQYPCILVGMNAYQSEIYWGVYQVDSVGLMQPVLPDRLVRPERVEVPEALDWLGVGNAWALYEALLKTGCGKKISDIQIAHYPTANALLKLGEAAFLRGDFVSAHEAIPIYLRGQDAWKKQRTE